MNMLKMILKIVFQYLHQILLVEVSSAEMLRAYSAKPLVICSWYDAVEAYSHIPFWPIVSKFDF